MELNEFAKKYANRPIIYKKVLPRRGYAKVMMSVVQQTCIVNLVNVKGINYDTMCEESLGAVVPLEELTAEQSMLIIERGNHLFKKKQDDRHKRTFGSSPHEKVRPPMKIMSWQKNMIIQLTEEGVPYVDMLRTGIGEVKDIDQLTFKEAVRVVAEGTEIRDKRKRYHHERCHHDDS